MKSYTNQYNLLFSLSWAAMYLIHPSWALPIPVFARGLLFFGLIAYFFVLAYIMDPWFKDLSIHVPAVVWPRNLLKHVKDNVCLAIICFIAVLLHVIPISSPIYLVGDEALFLQNGLWIYDYFGPFWHKAAKYAFWIVIILAVIIVNKKSADTSDEGPSVHRTGNVAYYFLICSGLCLLVIYFILTRDLPFSTPLIRYPPVHKFLYLSSYFTLGINYIGPRLWQLIFYILSAIYLYRIVNMLYDRETALLGASIFLFSPVIFAHARFAETAAGVIFLIIIISYYFLRFLMYQDNRGLLLSSYFIGTGFLYKRDIFLMFIICSVYLVFHKFRNRKFHLIGPLKIISLSLFPIVPWLVIGKLFNWRSAWVDLSNFTSFKKILAYFLLVPTHMSWIIFFLLVLSIIFVLITRRNQLTLFMGFLFISFYGFYTSQAVNVAVDRFAMSFYPTIAVFLALLLSGIAHKIKWKHALKLISFLVTIYLACLCAVPSFSERLGTFRNIKEQYYPNAKAMQWVRDNLKDGEKILSFRFKPDFFYSDKYGIDKNKIHSFWYNLGEHDTSEKLLAYCRENNISYIIFPYGPKFADNPKNIAMRTYLKENKGKEFIEAAKFNIGENIIFIHRLKNI